MKQIDHFITGGSGGSAARFSDVFDPKSGAVQAQVALGDAAVLDRAVAGALAAQPAWATTNPQRRARVMFEFKRLVEAHMGVLAHMLSSEHGKDRRFEGRHPARAGSDRVLAAASRMY